jgi:hypothetical protein
VTRESRMAQWNFLRKSTGCCLSPPSPLKKSTGVLDAMFCGDGDGGSGVFADEGVGGGGGGCVNGSEVLNVGDGVLLDRVHSVVLARVVVSSDSDGSEIRLSLSLMDEIWDVETMAVASAGVKRPLTRGCACQRARDVFSL